MLSAPLVVAYVIGAFVVGFLGRRRRMGFVGFLILSLLITPILGLFLYYLTERRKHAHSAD